MNIEKSKEIILGYLLASEPNRPYVKPEDLYRQFLRNCEVRGLDGRSISPDMEAFTRIMEEMEKDGDILTVRMRHAMN